MNSTRFRVGCHSLVALLLLAHWQPAPAEETDPMELSRIAFGSCARQDRDQPIWEPVVAAGPDLFIFAGDNIYGDTEDMDVMRAKYAQLGAKPGYRRLLETCPVLATWDDHDYGVNDGGASYPKREESAEVMLDFFGVPADSPRRQRLGIYGASTYGPEGRRVQVILLDMRTFKSAQFKDRRSAEEKKPLNLVGWYLPHPDPETTLLGAEQWAWLEEQLRQPAEWRLIVSSIQVVADEKGMESWGNFPHERRRLYNLIDRTGAEGVVFLSGDVHFSEVSRSDDGPYPLYDFTSSGLTNSHAGWAAAVNNHRVSERAYAEPTFGLVEFDWEAAIPSVSLQARGLDGEAAFEVKVARETLRRPVGADGSVPSE
jgi:alkaline phosphatase D